MFTLLRTTSSHPDFIDLVKHLDAYLTVVDGNDHAFYHQFNSINTLNHVVVAREDSRAVGCGAFKMYDPVTVEIKRMYTAPEIRGRGIATRILTELELWAAELAYTRCILETGKRQTEAVALYEKNGYRRIPNYGQYAGVDNSLCFEKELYAI